MNNVITKKVPLGIRYLSEWNDFSFDKFPAKCIINKQIPGCGFTEYCTTSPDENVIVCSPRKMLLQNKKDQHGDDVYLVVNEMDQDPGVDKDLSREPKNLSKKKDKTKDEELKELKEKELRNKLIRDRIFNELKQYLEKMLFEHKPYKILVTYDSYHLIKKMLVELGIYHTFYTVIDEFQSILHDARFKSDTEMRFMDELKGSHSALFVSATPTMAKYMSEIDEFKNLPYFQLDWAAEDPTRVVKPMLDVKTMKSTGTKIVEVLTPFLQGNFDSVIVNRNGIPTVVVSSEIVLYVNSVNHILTAIKNLDLPANMVNILCSETDENKKRIKKRLGSDYSIGTIPKKGEYHKPITFCTRTVYLGADFYSTCAKSYIFSDANIDSLAVDISEDLPQILGRQRLDENPWKNSATFFYRITADYRKMTKEDFDEFLERKNKKTENLLSIYNKGTNSEKYSLAENFQKVAKSYNYKDDYVAVNVFYNELTGDKIYKPTKNNLVYVNELRAFDIQQEDYKDRFSIFSKINREILSDSQINNDVLDLMTKYENLKGSYDKLKLLCDLGLSGDCDLIKIVNIFIGQLPDCDPIKSYFTNLGPSKIRSVGYDVFKIKKALGIIMFDENKLDKEIYFNFKEGDKFTMADLKIKISNIYGNVGYSKSPKATDILEYFEAKKCKINIEDENGNKKRTDGFELLKRLK